MRLGGILSDDTYIDLDDHLEEIIKKMNIRYVVFNIEELKYIDMKGIETLLKYNSNLIKNGGKALVCGIKNDLVKLRIENSMMLNYMFEISDELGAINAINM